MRHIKTRLLLLVVSLFLILGVTGCSEESSQTQTTVTESIKQESSEQEYTTQSTSLQDIPEFENDPYVVINNNEPYFTEDEMTTDVFEEYSSMDSLGRCGVAYANICKELMPTEERGAIGQVKPSGWHTYKYEFVDGKYLYNRCHLIGFQLAGENANEKNLITGTRYLNVDGMLPFENMVADYVKETDNHVLYRVTPIYYEDNLVASGVLMEAESVEDNGAGISYCVYVYNNQPGVEIDYASGESKLSEDNNVADTDSNVSDTVQDETDHSNADSNTDSADNYVLNTNTKKFHRPGCSSVSTIKDSNRSDYTGGRDQLINEGYNPCKRCNP
ncbi:MAG: DNA/RNA non-specific endonuclease [Suipraeoptans sp.]